MLAATETGLPEGAVTGDGLWNAAAGGGGGTERGAGG